MTALLLALLALQLTAPPRAPALTASGVAWTEDGPDLATVSAYFYAVSIDRGYVWQLAATCAGSTAPFICRAPLPAEMPPIADGAHTLVLTVIDAALGRGAVSSAPVAFTIPFPAPVLIPPPPPPPPPVSVTLTTVVTCAAFGRWPIGDIGSVTLFECVGPVGAASTAPFPSLMPSHAFVQLSSRPDSALEDALKALIPVALGGGPVTITVTQGR